LDLVHAKTGEKGGGGEPGPFVVLSERQWCLPEPGMPSVDKMPVVRTWVGSTNRREVNMMATVELQPGESQERLLKRFRKKVQKERVLSTVKRKRFFVSKSEQKRIALRKAKRRERRRQWKSQQRYRRFG
jgi:small subunit ribosomal protein S21